MTPATAPPIAIRARQLQRVANRARIAISNCTFRGNGDLFAVSEHEGNASLAASDEFALHLELDAARFADETQVSCAAELSAPDAAADAAAECTHLRFTGANEFAYNTYTAFAPPLSA